MTKAYQQLKAPNDRNGNPRRLWMIYEFETLPDNDVDIVVASKTYAIDEGYRGMPAEARGLEIPAINITLAEYRRLKILVDQKWQKQSNGMWITPRYSIINWHDHAS